MSTNLCQAHLKGKWLLIYFGFTNCPEICPAEMEKVSKAVDEVEAKYGEGTILPVFISIDPERDSAGLIKEFLEDYNPKFVGLVGTPSQVESCARNWRVYYTVPDIYDSKDDYLVDHSIITYLVNPRGEFLCFFSKEYTVRNILNNIDKQMKKYNEKMNPFA